MMKKTLMVMSLAAGVSLHAPSADAAGSTQDLLIQKLTQVQLGLAPSDPARGSVLLRLADLHAERARQMSMQEIADGCTICNAGEIDREKALSFYTEALTKVPANAISKVYLQMGHLYELQGKLVQAEKSYQKMLESSSSGVEKADAYLSLGEMAFRKSEFAKAEGLYAKVLSTEGASSQGLAAYRKAWCAFRMGNLDSSMTQLEEILRNPKLQSRMSSARAVADVQFLEEVSRDLATFMAARGIKPSDAETLYSLTPEAFRLQQVTMLAREGLRLGQKEASLQVWDFVYQKQSDPQARLEAQVRMAQLAFDLKNYEAANRSFQTALGLWAGANCSMVLCEESGKGLRQFIVGWNRLETAKPSESLIAAYSDFLKVFPEDEDMAIWAAQAAGTAEKFAQASAFATMATKATLVKLNTETDATTKKSLSDKLEKNLLFAIENAEKAKDENLLLAAQNNYLASSVDRTKVFDVQYQKAYGVYQKGDYATAAPLLKELAMNPQGPQAVRQQAAELALDALALLKDDQKIQSWSGEFAEKFADKRTDFQKIHQKSILTQSAQVAAAQPAEALAVLTQFRLIEADPESRVIYHKNKILLNEKMNRIREARVAVEDFLREANISTEDREFALGRKVWFAELELDFKTALSAAEQMKFAELSADERILKLAMYSELADKSPETYYMQYLKQAKDADKKPLIATQLLRLSKAPLKDFESYKVYFKNHGELLARAALEVYSNTKDDKVLLSARKERAGSKNDAFVMIEKILVLKDIQALSVKVAAHEVDTKSQRAIATGLKARVGMLSQLDTLANRAIESGDWASQLLALDVVAKENLRFYNEALALPMPEGLTPDQENEYLTILSQQVAPHQNVAMMAETKRNEFWSQQNALDSYKDFLAHNSQWGGFILPEVEAVAQIAPEEQKSAWQDVASQIKTTEGLIEKPSLAELESARMHLRANPFEPQAIQKVIALEKKAQRKSMVEYLEGRLATLRAPANDAKEKQ